MAWTENRVEKLKELWAEGYSASQIAHHIGNTTRNAVIGKIHRLGLAARSKPKASRVEKQKPVINKKTAVSGKLISKPEKKTKTSSINRLPVKAKKLPNGEYATVLTLMGYMCKWPLGDPSDEAFRFCGRKTVSSLPYCESHVQIAYQPGRKKKVRKVKAHA